MNTPQHSSKKVGTTAKASSEQLPEVLKSFKDASVAARIFLVCYWRLPTILLALAAIVTPLVATKFKFVATLLSFL